MNPDDWQQTHNDDASTEPPFDAYSPGDFEFDFPVNDLVDDVDSLDDFDLGHDVAPTGDAGTDDRIDDMMRVRRLLLDTIERRTRRHHAQTQAIRTLQATLDDWLATETDARRARVAELERAIEEHVVYTAERFGRTTYRGPWGTVAVTPADKRADWTWPGRVSEKAALCAQLADIDAASFVRSKTVLEHDANAIKKHAVAKDGHAWLNGEQLAGVATPTTPKVTFR